MANSFERPENPQAVTESKETRENKLTAFAFSKASEQHPDHNEDSFVCDLERGVFGVFDGVGGRAQGTFASSTARDFIEAKLRELPANGSGKEMELGIRCIMQEANAHILEKARGNGMGTTASVVKLFRDETGKRCAVIGNVGDSRVYIKTQAGVFDQLTVDHSHYFDVILEKSGSTEARRVQKKLSEATNESSLTSEEFLMFKSRNIISQMLGQENVTPYVVAIPIEKSDVLLITSDGIHDNLTQNEIEKMLATPYTRALPKQLVLAARARSREGDFRSKKDDMTAVIVELGAEKE